MTLLDPTTHTASPENAEERAPSHEVRAEMPRAGVEPRRMGPLERVLAAGLLLPVRFYRRFLSPLKPPTCRFHPTCSAYFLEAVQRHGPLRGSWMGVKRLLKCHPYHRGGYDPVE